MHTMQCHACNDSHVYRNNTQDAAKKDSRLFSSGDLVDVDVSLNRRGKWEETDNRCGFHVGMIKMF